MYNHLMNLILNGLMGLCIFLYGIRLLSNTLENISESKMERIIYTYTNSSLKCFFIGIILTAFCGSSTAITAITLSFISSKHLTLKRGLIIVIASNIGTSFTSILFNFNFSLLVPFLMMGGIFLYIFSSSTKLMNLSKIIIGCSFLFFGLNYLITNLEQLLKLEQLSSILINLNSSSLLIFVVGIFITALIQSSSAGIGMVQKLCNSRILLLKSGIAFMLGANIGTTLTCCVASLTGNKNAKIVAFINLLFNLLGSIIFMIFLTPYNLLISVIGKKLSLNPDAMVSLSHILYNAITVLIFILCLNIKTKHSRNS